MWVADDLREISEDLCFSGRKTLNDAACRLDMRAVVIGEFWAMMAGALPYGWQMRAENVEEYEQEFSVVGPGSRIKCDFRTTDSWSHYAAEEMLRAKAWSAEYAARPRMDEQ